MRVGVLLREANAALNDLRYKQSKCVNLAGDLQARAYHDEVCPAMDVLRAPIDHLEMIVDSQIWPMPTYDELMFNV